MADHLTLRRLLLLLGIAATIALTSACGGGTQDPQAATPPPLVNYRNSGLSFSHPAAWKEYPFAWPGELHFRPIVYLSTQPVHNPCSTHGNVTSCGFPVKRLEPGGVLAMWEANGIPAGQLGPGARIRVAGREASRSVVQGGECRRIGGDRTIDVAIRTSPTPSPLLYFTACLRGPNLGQNERSVDALLASTRFPAS